jgi:hypothetical protein
MQTWTTKQDANFERFGLNAKKKKNNKNWEDFETHLER